MKTANLEGISGEKKKSNKSVDEIIGDLEKESIPTQ